MITINRRGAANILRHILGKDWHSNPSWLAELGEELKVGSSGSGVKYAGFPILSMVGMGRNES